MFVYFFVELLDSVEVGAGSQVVSDNVSPRQRRQLPSKNTVSLRTELKHPKGNDYCNIGK